MSSHLDTNHHHSTPPILLKQEQVVALVCTIFNRCNEDELPHGKRRRASSYTSCTISGMSWFLPSYNPWQTSLGEPVLGVCCEHGSTKYFLVYDNFNPPWQREAHLFSLHSMKRMHHLYQDNATELWYDNHVHQWGQYCPPSHNVWLRLTRGRHTHGIHPTYRHHHCSSQHNGMTWNNCYQMPPPPCYLLSSPWNQTCNDDCGLWLARVISPRKFYGILQVNEWWILRCNRQQIRGIGKRGRTSDRWISDLVSHRSW